MMLVMTGPHDAAMDTAAPAQALATAEAAAGIIGAAQPEHAATATDAVVSADPQNEGGWVTVSQLPPLMPPAGSESPAVVTAPAEEPSADLSSLALAPAPAAAAPSPEAAHVKMEMQHRRRQAAARFKVRLLERAPSPALAASPAEASAVLPVRPGRAVSDTVAAHSSAQLQPPSASDHPVQAAEAAAPVAATARVSAAHAIPAAASTQAYDAANVTAARDGLAPVPAVGRAERCIGDRHSVVEGLTCPSAAPQPAPRSTATPQTQPVQDVLHGAVRGADSPSASGAQNTPAAVGSKLPESAAPLRLQLPAPTARSRSVPAGKPAVAGQPVGAAQATLDKPRAHKAMEQVLAHCAFLNSQDVEAPQEVAIPICTTSAPARSWHLSPNIQVQVGQASESVQQTRALSKPA